MSKKWLLYGATGYTAGLVAALAAQRGQTPVLAGRNAEAVRRQAEALGFEHRVFALDDPAHIVANLQDIDAVAHLAGPFVHTSKPMVDACLTARAHYLDITGEFPVFEAVLTRDAEAKKAGISLIPGVGFDVVPTDCLAKALAERLPEATELELAFAGVGGDKSSISRGTLKTMIEFAHGGAYVRRDGKLTPVSALWRTPRIPFPGGTRQTVTIPWGDLATAYRSTGIPNIAVYNAASLRTQKRLEALAPLFTPKFVRRTLQAIVQKTVVGPDENTRANSHMEVWGRVTAPDGRTVTGTFTLPEGYSFTADATLRSIERVLAGDIPAGALTPSLAFGPGFVKSMEGVTDFDFQVGD
jgi:short subunit dehydrogenase-like uncharacterized protein